MAKVSKSGVKKKLENLGVYKPEFDSTIERYVELQKEYDVLYGEYAESGYECTVETPTGRKKSPEVIVLESLRKDLHTLENSLGLTPFGLLKLQENAFQKPKNTTKKDGLL